MLTIFFLEARQPVQARSLLEVVAVEHATYPPLYEAVDRLAGYTWGPQTTTG